MRRIVFLLLALGLAIAVVPAASAIDAGPMRGSTVGRETGYNPDPAAVAARCPVGYQWILSSESVIQFESDVYTGPLFATEDHCSRWLHAPKGPGYQVLPGKMGAGVQVMTTPGGDTLTLATRGTFVLKGDLSIFSYRADVASTFTIVDGTGVFEGASGHGALNITDNVGVHTGQLVGSLAIDN
ncbi:MAG: hypothetical protein ABFS21_01415 [Actinomycetota bacterium]